MSGENETDQAGGENPLNQAYVSVLDETDEAQPGKFQCVGEDFIESLGVHLMAPGPKSDRGPFVEIRVVPLDASFRVLLHLNLEGAAELARHLDAAVLAAPVPETAGATEGA